MITSQGRGDTAGRARFTFLLLAVLAIPVLAAGSPPSAAAAEPLTIAAASSLKFALDEIIAEFTAVSGVPVRVSYGASGNIARQIRQGAPFDLFLSADESYVFELAAGNHLADEGRLYGRGQLALFARDGSPLDPQDGLQGLAAALRDGAVGRVAMANPDHAPYGRAARQALQSTGLWEQVLEKQVLGENAGQAARFALSGSTDAALLPYSLVLVPAMVSAGNSRLLPADSYTPINHRMAVTRNARPATAMFFDYLLSEPAQTAFRAWGLASPL